MRTKPYDPRLTEAQVTAQVVPAGAAFGIVLERRNVGGMVNASGQYVPFGRVGGADWHGTATLGPNRGRRVELEIKREGFDPRRLKAGREPRAHFDRQLAELKKANAAGALATWVDSLDGALRFFRRVATVRGLRVAFEGDFPVMEWD